MADSGGIRAGRAYVELGANDSQLKAALDGAAAKLQAYGQTVRAIGSRLAAVGGAGLAGFAAAVGQFTAVGSQLERMSQRTGLGVESLSAFGYAMEQSGSSLESFEGALQSMQGKLVAAANGSKDAQDGFLMLGLTWRQLAPLDAAQQVQVLAEQISKVEHPARRAQLAMQVFGSTDLLPFLSGGAKGCGALTDEAGRLGLVMSGETAASAAAMARATNQLRASLQVVAITIGASVGPLLVDVAKALLPLVKMTAEWVRENKPLVVGLLAGAAALAGLGTTLVAVGTGLSLAGVAAGGFASTLGLLGTAAAALWPVAVVAGKVALAVGAVAAAGYLAARGVNALAGAKLPQREGSGNKLADAGRHVWDTIATAAAASWQRITALVGDRSTAVGRAMGTIAQRAAGTWGTVRDTAVSAWESVRGTATQAAQGITAAIQAGRWDLVFAIASAAIQLEWAKLTGYLQTQWLAFSDWWAGGVGDMRALVAGAWAGVQSAWVQVTSFLVGDWDLFVSTISQAWEAGVKGLRQHWETLGQVFNAVIDGVKSAWDGLVSLIQRITEPINKALEPLYRFADSAIGRKILAGAGIALGGLGGAGLGAIGKSLADGKGLLGLGDKEGNKEQKEKRLADIDSERRAKLDGIDAARKAGEEERARASDALKAQLAERKAALEKELADSVNAARDAAGGAKLSADQRARGQGAAGALAGVQKADVSGSFNAAAAAGFGGRSAMDRVAANTADIKHGIDDLIREVKNQQAPAAVGG